MDQQVLDNLSLDQKTQTKHLYFNTGNQQPNLSNNILYIYDPTGSNSYKGDLNLSLFPNLKLITFPYNINVAALESIDISGNAKLNKIVIGSNGNYDPFQNHNSMCNFLVREEQLNRVVVRYNYYRYSSQQAQYVETVELLKNQALVPCFLVDDRNFEKLEAEVERLSQLLAEKDQQIEQLKEEAEQTPTLIQFQELNNIALPGFELDFDNLKREVKRLKSKDFVPYFQEQKTNFKELVDDAKDKAGSDLKMFLDLFLQTQKQVLEQTDESKVTFIQGQLLAYQNILQTKLDQDELRDLLDRQKEIVELENQLKILQF